MRSSTTTNILLALFATTATVSAQGVLTDGNSQFPACAESCPVLIQAAQACSATDVTSQGAWNCFCQSAYLVNLPSSATGLCDSTCSGADLQQISTWYTTNCGTDYGASEHPSSGAASTAAGADAASEATPATDETAAPAATDASSSSGSTQPGQNSLNGVGIGADAPATWWENHYQWIIMLIVLAIAFPLLGWGAVWLKRRYERKQDQITTGFNAGITSRDPVMQHSTMNNSAASFTNAGISGSGRNSPQRTRSAYMPYGYNYTRSESPNNARPVHPLARGETPLDMVERQSPANKGKKVLVRERSVEEGRSF